MLLSILFAFSPQTAGALPLPERPRDPWVFRSVLDGRPRMVTLALSKEMWVAYDAARCSLVRAWKGGVHFDGTVYTTEHGPQPTSEGTTYTQGVPQGTWQVEVSGTRSTATTTWRGYELAGGRATLLYELGLPDGHAILVRETPEYRWFQAWQKVRPETSFPGGGEQARTVTAPVHGLTRSFAASSIPPGARLSLEVNVDGARDAYVEGRDDDSRDWHGRRTNVPQGSIRIELTAERPRCDLTLSFDPRAEPPTTPTDAGDTKAQEGR